MCADTNASKASCRSSSSVSRFVISSSIFKSFHRFLDSADGRRGCGESLPPLTKPATPQNPTPLAEIPPLSGMSKGGDGSSARLPVALCWGRLIWGRMKRLNARIENSWAGDILAGIGLAIFLVLTPFIIWGFQ